MVANQPIERPGSADFLVNALNAAQQQADEQTRQSKFPLIVSHLNTSGSRVVDLAIVPNPSGLPGAVVLVYDGIGNLVVGSDADAGYGLAQPQTQVPMYPTSPGAIFNSGTSFVSYYTGQVQQNNSCFVAQWNMDNSYGGAAPSSTVESYVKIVDLSTGWSWQSPTVQSGPTTVTAPGLLTTCGPYSVQVPKRSIGNTFTVDIYSRVVSGGGGSSIAVTPQSMTGTSWFFAQAYFNGTTSS
jgi:hypothetical protein